ncbi:MAG TPA: hypothetical protein VIJ18_05025 [Microbacteriaceae bacterium]
MVSLSASAPQQELAQLRFDLLAGRGPGASEQEIAAHTRDCRWLGGLPTTEELDQVAHQAMLARIGATFTSFSAIGRFLARTARVAAVCMSAALVVRAVLRPPLGTNCSR